MTTDDFHRTTPPAPVPAVRVDDVLLRVSDEVRQAHLLDQVTGFHVAVGEEHDAHQHRQQKDMHHIQHPGAAQDFQRGHPVAVALQDLAVGEHRGVAGEEHEHFRGIAEADVAQGDLAEGVVGDVIPEDEDQRQAPKKIDAWVASVQHGSGLLNKKDGIRTGRRG